MPRVSGSFIKRRKDIGRNIQLAGTEIKYDSALRDDFFFVWFLKVFRYLRNGIGRKTTKKTQKVVFIKQCLRRSP